MKNGSLFKDFQIALCMIQIQITVSAVSRLQWCGINQIIFI